MSGSLPLAVARRSRWVRVALGLVASACLAAACGGSDESESLGGPGEWLIECGPSGECASGDCVCGVCTEVCAAGTASCSQPGSSCFTSGSLGYAATCEPGEAAGVCLPGCISDDDCADSFACAVGACVPSARLGNAESRVDEVARQNGERFETTWFTFVSPPTSVSPSCDDTAQCPTLDALLSRDACFEVRHGCGLTYLKARSEFTEAVYHYWYDAFGAAPVAVVNGGTREALGTLPEDCPIDVACSTCGQPSSTFSSVGRTLLGCEQVPRALPPPPSPAPVEGCTCELDEAGNASVSLDCFCSIYDCPNRGSFVGSCPAPSGAETYSLPVVHDTCGKIWFSTATYTGQHFSFSASGELLGAVAFSQGPVTAPCGTYQVSAGSAPCDVAETCNCWEDINGQSCATTPWYAER